MKIFRRCLLYCLMFAACLCLYSDGYVYVSVDTSAIYEAVFDHDFATVNGNCYADVENQTSKMIIDDDQPWGDTPEKYANIFPVDSSAAKALFSENLDSHSLNWKPKNNAIRFWSSRDLEDEDGRRRSVFGKVNMENSCSHYLYSVSAPGVAKNGVEALIVLHRYCGAVCVGGEDVLYLRRNNGTWKVEGGRMLSIN